MFSLITPLKLENCQEIIPKVFHISQIAPFLANGFFGLPGIGQDEDQFLQLLLRNLSKIMFQCPFNFVFYFLNGLDLNGY